MSTARDIARKANEFAVWRAGNSVKWDCSAEDIASEVGISPSYVGKICRAKGWGNGFREQAPGNKRMAADRAMQSSYGGRYA